MCPPALQTAFMLKKKVPLRTLSVGWLVFSFFLYSFRPFEGRAYELYDINADEKGFRRFLALHPLQEHLSGREGQESFRIFAQVVGVLL